jgi:tetratricopeptide (TPR) repeat protein
MTLRFNTLSTVLLPDLKVIKKSLIFLILLTGCPVFSQNSSAIEDVKEIARKVFEDEDYTTAYKMYSQLVANYPKDPEYNFKLGVCMIFAEPDKKKCLPYLQFAAKNQNAETQDIYFFLGKAYHINYLFDEAIKNYSEFKRTAPASGCGV